MAGGDLSETNLSQWNSIVRILEREAFLSTFVPNVKTLREFSICLKTGKPASQTSCDCFKPYAFYAIGKK